MRLEMTPAARALVARAGFDPVDGARPLKRCLQHELESRVGRQIVAGEVGDGALVQVDARQGQLVVAIRAPSRCRA